MVCMFSFIVPVFNTEKYLDRCIKSLLDQDFKNYEIILVDNNSSDRSPEIIKKYQKQFPEKIRCLSCEIPGAAAARNVGIKEARGDYMVFVDSDDYISDKLLARVYEKIKDTKADIVTINTRGVDSDLGLCEWSDDIKRNFIVTGLAPYGAAIKRRIFVENNLLFHEGIIYEDTALMGSLVLYADKVAKTDEFLYFIEARQDSVMRQKKWNQKIGDSIFIALDDLYNAFRKKKAVKKYYAELEQVHSVALLYVVANYMLRFKEGKPYYRKIRHYLKERFPRWYKNEYIKKHYSFKIRVSMLLHYFGMQWLIRIIVGVKAR